MTLSFVSPSSPRSPLFGRRNTNWNPCANLTAAMPLITANAHTFSHSSIFAFAGEETLHLPGIHDKVIREDIVERLELCGGGQVLDGEGEAYR
ncbi:hypothetical protein C0991_012179 [Blastosporella zonata]|nr:hypothetical protein C0991_012179 [Blastosporella zonata]